MRPVLPRIPRAPRSGPASSPTHSLGVIVTAHPYAPYLDEIAAHPVVSGLRLNTVMPVKEKLPDLLARLQRITASRGKDLWVDLKGRQLRVQGYWVPPFTEIRVSHQVTLDCPAMAFFSGGKETATITAVDGDRLILLDGPRRVVGPGESINIMSESLRIDGYLTTRDIEYIRAAGESGVNTFMLSYVEGWEDLDSLLEHVQPVAGPSAPSGTADTRTLLKIESRKGLEFVKQEFKPEQGVNLMAACGDLYVEVERPHQILGALDSIIHADPDAVTASRILGSLADDYEPSFSDILAVRAIAGMGFKTLMLGDEVCLKRDSVLGALNVIQAIVDG